MLKQGLILIAFTSSFLGGIASASEHANPRTHAIQSMDGTHIIGWHLMTADEKKEYQENMRNARTEEDRQQILRKNHNKMKARARERGVPLREMPPGQERLMEENDNQYNDRMGSHKMH